MINNALTKLDAALLYASWGWPVLPIVPNGKIPATQHGVKDATTDPDKIRRWWETSPDCNVAVAAGEQSGLAIVDVDPRNGGLESWEDWVAEYGELPDGAMAITAGGGFHYLARYEAGIRSRKLADGIDLLSDGRYFLVYPSVIEGRSYHWEISQNPIDGVGPVSLPLRWTEAISTRKRSAVSPDGQLISGNRNDGLTALAGAMRYHGMTEAEILAALTIANETRCEIPLPSSEVAQIARSVARYEPTEDTASDVALGSEAVESLLESDRIKKGGDYYLTRATSFLTQPAPIAWLIDKWIPAHAIGMIYGESGAGKTFACLDIAGHIATGRPWCGLKTKQGIVVYLAGEGHYGLRQRIAAWAKRWGPEGLENLLVSNRALDLDSAQASAEVIRAVRDLTDKPVALVLVDTTNNHMSGDENLAVDTRRMFGSCGIISNVLEASVIFAHHSGHNPETKHRARGSSVWRASVDMSIWVSREEQTGPVKLICTKQKDAEIPDGIVGDLAKVDTGWIDEDGKPIIGAVFVGVGAASHLPGSAPTLSKLTKAQRKLIEHRRLWEAAWEASGREIREGLPYLTREALRMHLVTVCDISEGTVHKWVKGGNPGKLITELLAADWIESIEGGWLLVEDGDILALTLG